MSDVVSAILGGVPLHEKMEMERLIYHSGNIEAEGKERKMLASAFAYIAAHEGISMDEMLAAIMHVKALQKVPITELEIARTRANGIVK